jgi:hypothetical protein
MTRRTEPRTVIIDPLTGEPRAVETVQLCFGTALGAGGLARLMPNQWDMTTRLRRVPDSVEEFTGYSKGNDPFGGDLWGYEPLNVYKANGKALVRNVRLPADYNHALIPNTRHLVESQEIIDWINN